MSNFLAIATVTAALRKTLQEALDKDVPGAAVTMVRPDGSSSGVPNTGANLYLYMVTPNAALRNADMPNRSSEGRLVQRPQVALDLHYLVTFYGDDSKLESQRLLGSVVRTLHAMPVLERQMIRDTIGDPTLSFLESSNLANALETVKFAPASLSLEELSKLWSVFFQTPYRLSVAYIGTVVLIESEDAPQSALPVRERNLYAMPFQQPVIEQVLPAEGADKPIVAESTLVIRGKKLRGDITRLKINGIEITPGSISETKITIPLSWVPSSLLAGVHGLKVVHKMLMGTPPVPHNGVESNLTGFVLHPTITGEITVSNIGGAGNDPRSADLTIKVKPAVGKGQRVVLLLNEISSGEAVSYIFVDESSRDDTDTVKIPLSGVKAADYLVRIQVDGAQSQLVADSDENSPTFNQYTGPKVRIP